jgi:hypothetical protein
VQRPPLGDVLVVAAVSGTVSGLPSTIHAIATGRSPLAAARAAGALVGRPGLVRGGIAHAGITVLWSVVLAAVLPPGREVPAGAAAAAGIYALDFGVIGRRIRPLADLPQWPQFADHVAFGAAAGAVLAWRRSGRSS